MITEADIRRLGKIRSSSDDARNVFKEYPHVFKPLLKLFEGRESPLKSFDDTDWLLELIERETGLNTRKPEETIAVIKAFKQRKKNREAKKM